MNEPTFVAKTLAWCNKQRKEKGKKTLKKMPLGKRQNPSSCPCGNATELNVWGNGTFSELSDFTGLHPKGNLPRPVQSFIRAFDAGKLPQYDEEAS